MKSLLAVLILSLSVIGCATVADGPVTVNGMPMTAEEVSAKLVAEGDQAFTEPIVIRADEDVPVKDFNPMFVELKKAGYTDVSFERK
jgi:biopolymer transport protein ExbD